MSAEHCIRAGGLRGSRCEERPEEFAALPVRLWLGQIHERAKPLFLNSRYLVSACPETEREPPLYRYAPVPLSAPDVFILSGPLSCTFSGFRWTSRSSSGLFGLRRCGRGCAEVSCQPVVSGGLITQTPTEQLLEGN